MITTKERAFLISHAGKLTSSMQVGKEGLSEHSHVQIDEMLNKNEIAKIRVLNNCPFSIEEVANDATQKANAELVKIIGHVFILYRKSNKPKVKHLLV